MLVTCYITKEKIEKNSSYSITLDSGRRRYFKNEELYRDHTEIKEKFIKNFKLYSGMKELATINKKTLERFDYFISQGHTWKELLKSIEFKKSDIIEVNKKFFSSTAHKNMYICKIIEDGICVSNQYGDNDHEIYVDIDTYNNSLSDVNDKNKPKKYFIKRRRF